MRPLITTPRLFKTCLALALFGTICRAEALAELPTAQVVASEMKIGWNLGNTLEAIGGETAWGNPVTTQALIDSVKAAGFNTVRVPCAWDSYATDGVIDADWMARVKEVVDYCIAADMYVVLNSHWDNGWLEKNCTEAAQASVNAKQEQYWTQIAEYFKDYDERLLFASANEPDVSDATGMAVLLSYHQTFIDAVRATGSNNASRTLVIQGPSTDIEKTNTLMNTMPTDSIGNRLIVEVHYYTPYQFCLMTEDASWGSMAYYWGEDYHSSTDTAHNATWGEESTVDSFFGMMKTKFVDKGIPVIIGEFGAIKRSLSGDNLALHKASRVHYYKYCTEVASRSGMVLMVWDAGFPYIANSLGLIDRSTNSVADSDVVEGMMEVLSPRVSAFEPEDALGVKWSYDWGWIDDSYFPWVYSYADSNWFYLYDGMDADLGANYWTAFYKSDFSDYGWGYVYPGIGWWEIMSDMSAEWLYF